jgi:hypothetical protein
MLIAPLLRPNCGFSELDRLQDRLHDRTNSHETYTNIASSKALPFGQ